MPGCNTQTPLCNSQPSAGLLVRALVNEGGADMQKQVSQARSSYHQIMLLSTVRGGAHTHQPNPFLGLEL